MCGIYGIFGREPDRPPDAEVLTAMDTALVHRGPDGRGLHVDGSLGMGMRRLSIIDLKGGEQPISNEQRSVWVVFNGEIYNYRELTSALIRQGHTFATASDTEVLVHLYEEYGPDCVQWLRGMFVFAIWNAPQRELFIARDRLGIKPLYYADTPHGLVFASELKALIRSPWVPREPSPAALRSYLSYGYIPDPMSFFRGVAKLPPGHTLTIRHGRVGPPRRYWVADQSFGQSATPQRETDALDTLRGMVQAAVRCHLVSDVPVGAFLSGGIDSSAVVALMAREAGTPVKTFSVSFSEPGFDEGPYARRVAALCGTEHHELRVEARDLNVLEDVLEAIDEPFADSSAIPTYLVSRLASQHVKVVLSGDGGDEIFAGYDRYVVDYRRRWIGLFGDLRLGIGLKWLSAILSEGTPGKNYLHNLSLSRMERYLDAIMLFPPRVLRHFVEPPLELAAIDPFRAHLSASTALDSLSRLQAVDLNTYLPGDILVKLDRMSMAHSLEARVPLLDHLLVEYACSLPTHYRMRGVETKYLFKRALASLLPVETLTRPKQGFGVPLEVWFARDLPNFFRDQLGDGQRLANLGIRPAAIRSLLDAYSSRSRPDHCHRLWALTVLDKATRRFTAKSP